MAINTIRPVFETFKDIDGDPLDGGQLYIGQPDIDAEASSKAVYWDETLLSLAVQPITIKGGYAMNGDEPGNLYLDGDYSMKLKNMRGTTVHEKLRARNRVGIDVVTYEARSDAVTAISAGYLAWLPEGGNLIAGGVTYIKMPTDHPLYGADPISDMPGYFYTDALAADLTLNIPSQIATLQGAVDATRKLLPGIYTITLNIDSGHTPASGLNNSFCDLQQYIITSDDAEVTLDAGWSGEAFIKHLDGEAPRLGTIVNCGGYAAMGVFLQKARMLVLAGCGIKGAAITGGAVDGVGFFVYQNSELTCIPEDLGSGIVGLIAQDNERRGVQVTWNSEAEISYSQFSGNGSDITDTDDHCSVFVSRTSSVHADFCTHTNEIKGFRVARSTVCARDLTMESVQQPIWLFEEGFVSAASSSFDNCGFTGYPLFQVQQESTTVPGGGGTINVSSSTITDPQSTIADAREVGAMVNISNCTITGALDYLATAGRGGVVMASVTSITLAAGYLRSLVATIGGATLFAQSLTIVGGGYATTGVQVNNGGKAYLRNSNFSGLTNDYETNGDGCEINTSGMTFASGSSIDGSLVSTLTFLEPATLPGLTVSQLNTNYPAASNNNAVAICTNEVGGTVLVFSDGSFWRRVTDRNAITT